MQSNQFIIFSDAPNEDDSPMFQRAMNTFYKTFIKVDNPVAIYEHPFFTGDKSEGIFPAPDGIEFEVKTPNWIHPEEKVAVLIPLKQEPDNSTSNDIRSETRSGFTICPHSGLVCYDPECGVTTNICNNSHCFREPGNEAKKEDDITCPFCGEKGFDKKGLKYHLYEFCDAYRKTEMLSKF